MIWRVIAESALRLLVGGNETMRFQLKRLLEFAKRPNIEIQVLQLSAGAHTGVEGPWSAHGQQHEHRRKDPSVPLPETAF